MKLKELTQLVESQANCKVTWELGKTYIALNSDTGEVVAKYNPKMGVLKLQEVTK